MKARTSICGRLWLMALVFNFAFCILHCHADLVATVTPGYTFATGERPTTATLNLLANPSILISGTIGGTNAGLTAASVNGTHLADSVADEVTITWDGSSPRRLQTLTSGLAGPGLTGATDGGPLTNNVDGVTIRLTNDVVSLHTNLPLIYLACPSNYTTIGTGSGYLTNISMNSMAALLTNTPALITVAGNITNATYQATNYFVSGTIGYAGWGAGNVTNAAHGLGVTPKFVRVVLVCIDPDVGYAIGDEVDIDQAGTQRSTYEYDTVFAYHANSTYVSVTHSEFGALFYLIRADTGVRDQIDRDDWVLKIYAKP
jgi:hypothetical protein